MQNDSEIAKQLSEFFKNAVSTLGITENSFIINKEYENISEPVQSAVVKFESYPSISLIKNKITNGNNFKFEPVSLSDIELEIRLLNPKKATTHKNIPPKILKSSCEATVNVLRKLFNETITKGVFPNNLKLADVTPVFKKDDPFDKKNYRPVSVLPTISKIYKKLMQKQINNYITNYLSPYLCGCRKGYNTQQALVSLIEKWKKILDDIGFGGAVLMDLSKAFDTLNHELLIAKLHAYGLNSDSLKLINDYLSNRWQRTKINKSFSSWAELVQGVPQGSVLGPLLFNIYLNDLFYLAESTEVCNFADDTTFFACDKDWKTLISRLEHDSHLAIEWFESNYMKLNQDKCHLLVSGYKHENIWARIGEVKIWESSKQKLLGVVIGRDLSFNKYVSSLCKKAGRKLSVLSTLSNLMSFQQRRLLMKSFVEAQFGYCPLVWMFHGREINRKINHIHERSLRIVYRDYNSSFKDLLQKDNSICIHHRNIQSLTVELFKVKVNLFNRIMNDIFPTRVLNYNLRSQTDFFRNNVNTTKFGLNSLRYFASKVWSMMPIEIKDSWSVEMFKNKISK